MFNTEIIHFLQSFDSPIFMALMQFVSALGMTWFIVTVIIGITFGISFKKGLVLVNVIAWTAFLTVFSKEQINFPRPVDVDQKVKSRYEKIDEDLTQLQPQAFWEIFSVKLLQKTRTDRFERYGFPSGHLSLQTALWMSLILLFRRRWILATGIIIVLLSMVSRMYLGSHFLGDVLAGTLLGAIITWLLFLLVNKSRYLKVSVHDFKSLSILWLPFTLILVAPFTPHWLSGNIIGLNIAALLIILRRNFPVFHVIIWKRVLAAVMGLVFFLAAFYVNRHYHFTKNDYLDILIMALISFIAVSGALSLSRRLNLIRFRY